MGSPTRQDNNSADPYHIKIVRGEVGDNQVEVVNVAHKEPISETETAILIVPRVDHPVPEFLVHRFETMYVAPDFHPSSVKRGAQVESLAIVGTELGGMEQRALLRKVPTIEFLYLPNLAEPEDIAKRVQQLRHLSMPDADDKSVELIGEFLPLLETLRLPSNRCTDEAADWITQRLHCLRNLDLGTNDLTDEAVEKIKTLPGLEVLTTEPRHHYHPLLPVDPKPDTSVTADKHTYRALLDLLVYSEAEDDGPTYVEKIEALPAGFSPNEGLDTLWHGPIISIDWKASREDIEWNFQKATQSVISVFSLQAVNPRLLSEEEETSVNEMLLSYGLCSVLMDFGHDSSEYVICKHDDVITVMALLLKIFPDQTHIGSNKFTPGSQKARAVAAGTPIVSTQETDRRYALETIAYERPLFDRLLDLAIFHEPGYEVGGIRAKVAALSPEQNEEEILVGPAGPIVTTSKERFYDDIEAAFRRAVQTWLPDFSMRPLYPNHEAPLAVHAAIDRALGPAGLRTVELKFFGDARRQFLICRDRDVYLVAALLMRVYPGRVEVVLGPTPGSDAAKALAVGPTMP